MGAGSSTITNALAQAGGQSSKGGQSPKGGGQSPTQPQQPQQTFNQPFNYATNPYAGRTQVSQLNYMLNQPMQLPYRAPQTSYSYQQPTPQPPMAYIQPMPSPYGYQQPGFGGKGGYNPLQMQMQQADYDAINQLPWYMRPTGMDERPEPIRDFGVMTDNPLSMQYTGMRTGTETPGQLAQMAANQAQTPEQHAAAMQTEAQQAQQGSLDALNQARQAGFQVGPTPNQPPNPYASMSVPQLQAMNQQNAMRSSKGGFQPQVQQRPQMMGGLASMLSRGFF